MTISQLGVGLQFNPAMIGWFPFLDQPLDALEILFDAVMAPLDGPGLVSPLAAEAMCEIASKFPLVGHSNYGGDFGFEELETTSAALSHVPLAKAYNVPWVSNHCFYSEKSWCDVWSSPLQFSRAEAARVARRAHALQEMYGVPLAHENAAYYRTCPGSDIPEEDFLAEMLELSGTYLHLDIHNLYANAINHRSAGYSVKRFLATIPLDRVINIHMAGGRWIGEQYHDLHDTVVPEAAWYLLEEVLSVTRPGAVILEYETDALYRGDHRLDTEQTIDLILADLDRARSVWDRAYGSARQRPRALEIA